MKKYTILLFLIICVNAYSQSVYNDPIPVRHFSGKYGFCDTAMNVLIPPQYDEARFFYHGLAAVKMYGQYGYIDKKGSMIIPAEWDYAGNFSDGIAIVGKSGGSKKYKYRFIDSTGKLISQTEYDKAEAFHGGAGVGMRNGKYYLVNKSGEEITEGFDEITFFSEGFAQVNSGGKWGYINPKGELVVKPQYDVVWNFYDGYAWVTNQNKTALIDKSGKIVEEFRFRDDYSLSGLNYKIVYEKGKTTVTRRSDGKLLFTAPVKVTMVLPDEMFGFTDTIKNLMGVINSKGQIAVQPVYQQFWPVTGKYIAVKSNNLWGLIDYQGNLKVPAEYKSLRNTPAGPFFETEIYGKKYLCQYNPRTGVLSRRCFQEVIAKFDNMPPAGFAFVSSFDEIYAVDRDARIYHIQRFTVYQKSGPNGKVGLIRLETDEWLTEPIYDEVFVHTYKEERVIVKKDGKFGFFGVSEQRIVIPLIYDGADDFATGLAPVKKGDKWGYIDRNGSEVLPFKYDKATKFTNGDAVVELEGRRLEIRPDGSVIKDITPVTANDPWKPNPDFGEKGLTESLSVEYYLILDSPYSEPGKNPSFDQLDAPEVINFSMDYVNSRYYSLKVKSSGVVNHNGKKSYIYNFEKTNGNSTYTQLIVQDEYNSAAFFTVHGGVVIYKR